jgi:hypothetical protein
MGIYLNVACTRKISYGSLELDSTTPKLLVRWLPAIFLLSNPINTIQISPLSSTDRNNDGILECTNTSNKDFDSEFSEDRNYTTKIQENQRAMVWVVLSCQEFQISINPFQIETSNKDSSSSSVLIKVTLIQSYYTQVWKRFLGHYFTILLYNTLSRRVWSHQTKLHFYIISHSQVSRQLYFLSDLPASPFSSLLFLSRRHHPTHTSLRRIPRRAIIPATS